MTGRPMKKMCLLKKKGLLIYLYIKTNGTAVK